MLILYISSSLYASTARTGKGKLQLLLTVLFSFTPSELFFLRESTWCALGTAV